MTIAEYKVQAASLLQPRYGKREANSIINLWFETRLNMRKLDLVFRANETIEFDSFEDDLHSLLLGKPLQHILGIGYFWGLPFAVNPKTLVPRPETEELVAEVITLIEQNNQFKKIVDVGTGSGCIAIALKKELPHLDVYAVDVDPESLSAAGLNAENHGVEIRIQLLDVLTMELPEVDVIVSNPPYIPLEEKEHMDKNVVDFDPPLALFVPDEDPLVFYRRLAELANKQFTNRRGLLAVEIHENFGHSCRELMLENGAKESILLQDLQGKDRMIIAHYG